MSLLLSMAVLLAVIGAFAGIIAGLLGVGGGIILVPAFFFVFGILGYDGPQLMQICLATSLATIVVTSVRSVMAHHRKGAVDWTILRQWAPGAATGAGLASIVASGMKTEMLQIIFGVLGMSVGLYLAFGRAEWRLGDQLPQGRLSWAISGVLGFLSVLMGIGGGSFGVPLMTLYGQPIHRAVATAAGFGFAIAVPAVLVFLMKSDVSNAPPLTIGAVNLVAFAIVSAATLVTAPMGARRAHASDAKRLRRMFAGFILLTSVLMIRAAIVS